MIKTVTITPKFQVHIPRAIREKSGLTTHGPVIMRADKGKIVIEPRKTKSILDLAGKYKRRAKQKTIDIARIRDVIDYSRL